MKAEEKQMIYTLLKTAADSLCGYSAPAFAGSSPSFTDDESAAPAQEAAPAHGAAPAVSGNAEDGTLEAIAAKIAACTRCPLSATRTRTVPGTGVRHPAVVVIGEGPGHDEDVQGEPFVGAAGKLLDKMLAAVSLSRTANCYICNIVKCRPPQNRTPFPDEAAACSSFLYAQLALLKPAMILCVGSTAAKNLLKTSDGVMRLRGNFYQWNGIQVAVTYHPSALLRDQSLKAPAWEDLKALRARLSALVPDYAAPFAQAATGAR